MKKSKKKLLKRITKALDSIRPYLLADGGDVEVVELTDDMIVKVRLLGACNGCPMSLQTMKTGISYTIKKEIPEIKDVVEITNNL